MKPTAIELYTDIYSGLIDARLGIRNDERNTAVQEALDVVYRRLSALEELSAKPEVPR
jgi:hypothetical protein